jgi:lysophospholipase L1-like esterase
MERIAIFGDSIAAGVADRENGGWVGHLKQHLKNQGRAARLFNFGVAGDDSEALLERFEPQCQAAGPSWIIVAIGINDTVYAEDSSKVDSLRYSLNIERLIAQATPITRKVMFVGLTRVDERRTTPISRKPLENFDNELILAHDAALQSICHNRALTYVPMFDVLSDADLADGLHPNSEGHRKMFERLRNFL